MIEVIAQYLGATPYGFLSVCCLTVRHACVVARQAGFRTQTGAWKGRRKQESDWSVAIGIQRSNPYFLS